MHKRRLNELILKLTIEPAGPLLIKSGTESGADPTLPSMNFVRTRDAQTGQETIYLPGSSLKGVFRSHAERIIRTVLGDDPSLCCDPMDKQDNCSARIRDHNIKDTAEQYRNLCLACRTFGHMVQASHFTTADAYPVVPIAELPVRQHVAIDRLSGGVAFGPYDMEVALEGEFRTTVLLHNFELWQLGLMALVMRDLDEGRVRIGFAKSRGLGAVHVSLDSLEIGYPGQFGNNGLDFAQRLYGVGALAPDLVAGYDYQPNDSLNYAQPIELLAESSLWGRPALSITGNDAIINFLRPTVAKWAELANQTGGNGG